MARLKIILSWLLGISTLVLVLAFTSSKRANQIIHISATEIEIQPIEDQYFITPDEIKEIIESEYFFYDSLMLREINIKLLEERLDNHPSIRKAEVYSKLDGSLRIGIFQKQPLARVQGLIADYYIDELGDSMALSTNYYAKVPLVKGIVKEEARKDIHSFLTELAQDDFYKGFFGGLEILENEEWILYPKIGDHKILFGLPEDGSQKLKKLKKYYLNIAADQQTIESLKLVNLKYEGQVICRKH